VAKIDQRGGVIMVEAALPNPGGGDPTWVFAVTGLFFVIIIGAGIFLRLRRRK
jgi:LPXTG-motif cell wall-anchored protein